jgi:competence protein ComEA
VHPTAGIARAFLVILIALFLGGLVKFVYGRGRAVGEGFVIKGEPRQTLLTPANATPPLTPLQAGGPKEPAKPASEALNPPAKEVVVHIAGAVKRPGVYRFSPEARAQEALQQAGGANGNANLDGINLAARLEDGQQLYVPTKAEYPQGGAAPVTADAKKSRGGNHHGGSSGSNKLTRPGQGAVNINTANAQQLQRLPGVGPAMSARIIAFRKENGPFTEPEGLMDVTGIGEKKFAKMKPFVRVR